MNNPLLHPVFRCLYIAQVLSLLGIGLMTVGLALRAADIVGTAAAGQLLGALFTLKMVVYVLLAPVLEVWLSQLPPRQMLILLNSLRLLLLLVLSLATQVWQLLLISTAYYAASAAFTPLYQSLIPALLADEQLYTRALVYSRLAYTVESLMSPVIAALMLLVMQAWQLFPLAALCLAGSVTTLFMMQLPRGAAVGNKSPFSERLTRGLRIYLLTPRLRGLFLLNLALSLGLAWVLVNTVVYAGTVLQDRAFYTWLMAAYGAGSALAALSVPRLLQRFNERQLMVGGCVSFALLSGLILLPLPLPGLLMLWGAFGMASSLVLTPGALVLTRSAKEIDHPAVFAAQFSMSHAGWLLAYPLAGWLGANLAPATALVVLGGLCLSVTLVGAHCWPSADPLVREHRHPELPPDHPHLRDQPLRGSQQVHAHTYYIDELHLRWNR